MRHILSRYGLPPALAVLSAAVLAAQSGAPAGRPAEPQEQQPTFRTGTNFVRVDVYPMKGGKPVQGLAVEDFEVFEDGVRQTIDTFEHVLITPAGPQESRRDPSSTREALQEAVNPRNRVFIFFLDTPNVTVDSSHRIKEPIIRLIDRILGPDDLAAIMTPAMSTSQITLARKTVVLEQQLRDHWTWGTRFSITHRDEREEAYLACYPPLSHEVGESNLAKALITRKRERATLEALEDLVRWLHGVREERKAVITITEGWRLDRPDPELMRLRKDPLTGWEEPIPGPEAIGVGPTGKLTTHDERNAHPDALTKRECDTDRMRLSMLDNEQYFRDIIAQANRANASFYPVDPRGLTVWDAPLGPEAPPPPLVDQANLRDRHESLHNLAVGTDGLAVVSSNDLDKGLERIADDLTSYYLLGYYSTNTKLDGRYRRLEVKVKQPGVNVRARRGYRAPTAEEVEAARTDAEESEAVPSALTVAMGMLARIRPDARFRVNAAPFVAGDAGMTVWVAGELLRGPGPDRTADGGTADIEVRADGQSNTSRVTLQPGERGFVAPVALPALADRVQVRVRFSPGGAVVPLTDTVEVAATQPLLFRRGPSTGNRRVPAADFRFSRTERLHLELPAAAGAQPGTARLLDANGHPLEVPVKAGVRTDEATGQQWVTADVTLAPLAPADYAIEVTWSSGSETRQSITAFRVTR